MAIAVSVLLFIACVIWLIVSAANRGVDRFLAFLAFLATCAGGVLNIATDLLGIRIAVGILTLLHAIPTGILCIIASRESGGSGAGLAMLFSIAMFLLMAWTIVFGILQLTIVV